MPEQVRRSPRLAARHPRGGRLGGAQPRIDHRRHTHLRPPPAPGLSFGTARALIAEYAGDPPRAFRAGAGRRGASGRRPCVLRMRSTPRRLAGEPDFAGPAGNFWIPPTGAPVRPSKTSTSVACRPRDVADVISGTPSLFTSRAESESPRWNTRSKAMSVRRTRPVVVLSTTSIPQDGRPEARPAMISRVAVADQVRRGESDAASLSAAEREEAAHDRARSAR